MVPHFDEKLEDGDSSVRLETVEVVGKLLSEPGGSCLPDAGRIHLIKQFAEKRFMDVKVVAPNTICLHATVDPHI